MTRLPHDVLLLAGAWLVLSCDDSSGPSPDPTIPVPVQIGDTVWVRVDSGVANRSLLLQPTSDADVAIFVQSTQTGGVLEVFDSATGTLAATTDVVADADPTHLLFVRTPALHLPAGTAWLVRVHSASLRKPAKFRMYFYQVNVAPELVPAALTPGDTVLAETFENSADADEFTLPVTQGEEIIAFLKSAPATSSSRPSVTIYAPGATDPLSAAGGSGPTQDLETSPSTLVPMPSAGTARIVVRNAVRIITTANRGTGHYELLVRQLNRAPETVAASILPNDTVVAERIDHVGDIDEFTANLVAGESYRLFLQATDGNPGSSLEATILGVSATVTSPAGDTALADQFTPTVFAAASGPALIRVEGSVPSPALNRGGYRLFLYHINRAPEVASGTIVAGDSVLAETIAFPGDVDSFTVTSTSTGFINYVLQHPGGRADRVTMTWPVAEPAGNTCDPSPVGPRSCGGGVHTVGPAGEYLRITADPHYRGGYQVRTYPIDTLPEGVPPAFIPGQQVQEALNPAGDIDRYTVSVAAGDLFDFESHRVPLGGFFDEIYLYFQAHNTFAPFVAAGTAYRSGRFAFPDTGSWTLVVNGYLNGTSLTETGPYDFILRRVPVTPETAAPSLTATDTVRSEAIDLLSDVDEFIVTAPPGTEMVAAVTPTLELEALDPVTPDTIRTGPTGATGIFTVPAAGHFRLRVFEHRLQFLFGGITESFRFTGPYTLGLRPLDRAPETVPVAVTRGTQVLGESIDYAGDIDEYGFAGVAGDTVSIFLDNFASYGPLHLLLDFVNPLDGSVLTGTDTRFQSANTSPTVTLPVTGNYLIRVRGISDQDGTGVYNFTVN